MINWITRTGLLLIAALISLAFWDPTGADAKKALEHTREVREAGLIKVGKVIVSALLPRPDRARFGAVYVGRFDAVCGYVAGPGLPVSTFIVAQSEVAINNLSRRFDAKWNWYCKGAQT